VGQRPDPDYTPYEAGLDRFVRLNKGDFIGKAALEAQLKKGVPHKLHHLRSAWCHRRGRRCGNEPLFDTKGNLVGRATAGYYGHALGKSLGLGYVKPDFAAVGSELQIEILGERKRVTVLVDSPYDPENKDLRA
jgi:dimethylglycine dehydrogenase